MGFPADLAVKNLPAIHETGNAGWTTAQVMEW